jgi:hypothetical protein
MTRGNRLNLFSQGALLAALLAAAVAHAQQGKAVAHLKGITGNVLVSQESGLATGSESQVLTNGTRIMTTSNSEVVIVFDNGCEIRLKENQRFEVESDKPCALMVVQSLGGPPVAAVSHGFATSVYLGATAALILSDSRKRPAVSPN